MADTTTTDRDTGWLIVVAAPAEAKAVLRGVGLPEEPPEEWRVSRLSPSADLLVTGIAKANAAAGTALALARHAYAGVLNMGIAGALPVASPLALGDCVAATRSIYADEGLALPDGSLIGCADMGFPLGPFDDWGVRADAGLLDRLARYVSVTAPVATVSTCSGTDHLARTVVERTWAVAEGMEGAAVGQVAARQGVPFLELRVVSNTTGDRPKQRWLMSEALAKLSGLASSVVRAASDP